MNRAIVVASLTVTAIAAINARGEVFHSDDNVLFEGTLKEVTRRVAICKVRESGHQSGPDSGRPLDLWRADIIVHNKSVKHIDYLRADIWVRAERPHCTNWKHLLRPRDPTIPVVWGDRFERLEALQGMQPGMHVLRSLYVLVPGGLSPKFVYEDPPVYHLADEGDENRPTGDGKSLPTGKPPNDQPASMECETTSTRQGSNASRSRQIEVLIGVGLGIRTDDHIDFEEIFPDGVAHLVIKNDSRNRTTGMLGLGVPIPKADHVDVFASMNFMNNTSQAIDAFTFGLNFKVLKHVGIAFGIGLAKGEELSYGFMEEAKRRHNGKGGTNVRLDDSRQRTFDGLKLVGKKGSRFYPGSPIVESFNKSIFIGLTFPFGIRKLLAEPDAQQR